MEPPPPKTRASSSSTASMQSFECGGGTAALLQTSENSSPHHIVPLRVFLSVYLALLPTNTRSKAQSHHFQSESPAPFPPAICDVPRRLSFKPLP
mmetsp:Transcript_14330/g.57981  ORF Transcript_14330/g.57981 Transcript_14330/m.57981 type:complete len:95 (+) Transcript_14330:68-352(+)